MPPSELRAVSLWQPWASAIAVGAKRIETRSWATPYRGWLVIHAAKRWTAEEREWAEHLHAEDVLDTDTPPLGAFVAVAQLVGCGPADDALLHLHRSGELGEWEGTLGSYGPGRIGWLLADVRRLVEPVPAKGRQGMWTPEPAEVDAIRAQLPTRTGVTA